jgi:sec-independent protein translocase protein TatA
VYPLLLGLGPEELILILLVLILLFGASKLPDLARGSGRALRIFKAETKGLLDDDDKPAPPASALESRQAELDRKQAELDAERERLKHES